MGRKKVSELKDRTISAIDSATPGHSRNNDEAEDDGDKCGANGAVDNAQINMNETNS